jgi:hypothetical protein
MEIKLNQIFTSETQPAVVEDHAGGGVQVVVDDKPSALVDEFGKLGLAKTPLML